MLTPYICVTCERVIVEHLQIPSPDPVGPTSLIGLFSKFYIQAKPTEPSGKATIPPDAVIPKQWSIYTEWNTEPEDEQKQYTLVATVLYPDGKPFGEPARISVNVSTNRRAQVIVNIPGFPIGQFGMYTARVWIEEDQIQVVKPIDLKVELVPLPQ